MFSHEVTVYRTNGKFAALTEGQHVITSEDYSWGGDLIAKKQVIYFIFDKMFNHKTISTKKKAATIGIFVFFGAM